MEPLPTRPTEQELAFHTAWMRRLARALVADASAAEDVVQDAWAKLEPRRAPLGAGYLAAVVRSLAWSRHRSETRRSRREAASASPEALPSAAEVSARVEIARRVAEALQELPDPYRTTLVLRYYDDLSAAEIARRQGVPAATVRSHLARGLAQLRTALDAREGGRERWLGALVPFARPESTAASALVAALPLAIAMKLALAGLCAALGLALAWRFVARGGSTGGEPAAIAPAAPAVVGAELGRSRTESTAVDVSARTATEAAERAIDAQHAPAPAPPATFQVLARALDQAERPLAGAWLDLNFVPGRSPGAGQDGRIAYDVESAAVERVAKRAASGAVEVRVGAPGRRTLHLRPALAQGASSLDLGDLRLDPGAALEGRVVDESGLGVEGAVLVFYTPVLALNDGGLARSGPNLDPTIRFDGDDPVRGSSGRGGIFRLDGLPAGHGSLWARTELGLWSWSAPIGLRAGEEVAGIEIVVRDAPEQVIAGRVVDPQGLPLQGVLLTFRESDPSAGWWNARTDGHGRFHFVPREGRLQDIQAQSPDWEWNDLERRGVPAGTHDLELAFERSDWLDVEVRAVDGRPLRDGRVRGLSADGPTDVALARCESTLDAQGRARLRRPDVALRVRVEAPSFRSVLLGPFEPDSFPTPLIVTLEPLPALVGQVLLPDGRPAAGARVSLHPGTGVDARSGRAFQLTHQGWNGDGEPFVHLLHVEPMAAVTADDEGRYRLPLPGVDASASGEIARPSEGLAGLGYVSDATRRLATAKPQTPWYVHAAVAEEATLTSGPHTFASPQETELELRLPPGGSIAGRLRLDGSLSPAGWTMVATDALAEVAEARVAPDGTFRFDDLHAGGWQMSAYEPGQRHYREARMATARVPEPDVQVEVKGTAEYVHHARPRLSARLWGRLTIDGAPPGAWRVSVRTSTPQAAITGHETTLDPDGRFEVRLQPGLDTSLSLHGVHAGTQLWIESKLEVHSGDNDWSLELETARIEGWVDPARAKGTFFGGPFHVVESGDRIWTRTTVAVDAHGRFGPLAVGAGRGLLRGAAERVGDSGPIWAELDLAPGETRVLDLR